MTAIHELFSPPWAERYSYILETKEDFHEIGWLKAKLIRWLHLEKFLGTVYQTCTEEIRLLSEKVERTYKSASLSYEQIVSLSDTLHDIEIRQPSLDPIQKFVTGYALTIISSHLKSHPDFCDQGGFARYGTLQAEKFLEGSPSIELGAEACLKLYQEVPAHSKEVLGAFFARLQKTEAECIAQSMLAQYFVARFQSFYKEIKPSPSALAEWFKTILKEITEQFQKQAKDLECALICSMRDEVLSENLKESFQAYGIFVAEGLQGKIIDSFEKEVGFLRKLFRDDDFSLVMEGMMERKGVQYCQAKAQGMRAGKLSVLFPDFEDQARLNFSTASRQIVQGVIREFLGQVEPIGAYHKEFADIFVRMYQSQSKKEFSVFEPVLGTKIMVQKPIAKEATRSSLRDKRGIIKQTSEDSLWSNVGKTMTSKPQIPEALLKIEKNIVANMVQQAPDFPQYYGVFLGKKIKEVSQGSQSEKEWKKFYDVFIHQNFHKHAETMLNAMKEELQKPLEQRASTPPVWS